MRVNRSLVRLLLVSASASALLLAGCTFEPAPVETPDTPTASPEPSEPEDDDATGPAEGSAACLEGEWEADLDVIGQNSIAGPGLDAFGAAVVVTGSSVTTFDASTITTVYADQSTELTWSVDGQEFRMITRYDGTLTGAYTATDTELTITDVDTSALTLESTTFVNGEQFDLPGVRDVVDAGFQMGGTSTFTCTREELRLQPLVADVDTSAFVSVLHRR